MTEIGPHAPTPVGSARMRVWPGLALLVVAGLFIYGPVLRGSWVWDDPGEILERPEFHHWNGLWKIWTYPSSPDYLPLKSSVQWMGIRLWGESPTGFHFLTLGFHLLNAALFWRLLSRLRAPGAGWAGLLFIVHPLTVESVAWISELKNTLSLAPLLLAFLAYLDFEETEERSDYLKALGLFAAALLCKGSVVMFPCVLLGYIWWRRGRLGFTDTLRTLPFFGASLIAGLATIWYQHHGAIAGASTTPTSLGLRSLRAIWAVGFYAEKSIWPTKLMPIYPSSFLTGNNLTTWIPAGLFFLALGLAAFFARRGQGGRTVFFGLGFFLINLLPVIGFLEMYFLRISPVADHFAYLSLLGLIALVAMAWGQLLLQLTPPLRLCATAFGGLLCVALALESRALASTFFDEKALWSHAVQRNPKAWMAQHNLALVDFQAGDTVGAIQRWQKALELDPNSALTHNDLGLAWTRAGEKAKAREEFAKALGLSPGFPDAHANLAFFFLDEGNFDEAIEEFTKAAKAGPTAARYLNLGSAYGRAQRYDEASKAFQKAAQLDPESIDAPLNQARAFLKLGYPAEAVAQYQAALALQPNCAEAYLGLANVLATAGKFPEAEILYKQALRYRPELEEARKNLAAVEAQIRAQTH